MDIKNLQNLSSEITNRIVGNLGVETIYHFWRSLAKRNIIQGLSTLHEALDCSEGQISNPEELMKGIVRAFVYEVVYDILHVYSALEEQEKPKAVTLKYKGQSYVIDGPVTLPIPPGTYEVTEEK